MTANPPISTLGRDIRALRKARGLTLIELAGQMGRSVGWLSQVERDKSRASINELRQMAEILNVSVSTLFGHAPARAGEEGLIVRHDARRQIGDHAAGLSEELLSPDLTDDFEVVHSTFAPFSNLPTPVKRPTQEVGYIISGQLDLKIGSATFTLGPGDSFRIRGEPFQWSNPYDIPAVVIWVIAPPVY